jgi:excinuclease ABC subunit B
VQNSISTRKHSFETSPFKLITNYTPCGDQPTAIDQLLWNIRSEKRWMLLHGVTGTGKTFTIANVIASINRPTLVVAPNKTLAAQLYSEFREFFPENRVKYFVSYYDYYQPEAYIPSTDTYIEKDSAINEEIDKMRHSATKSLLEARDTIIVASVSCIYGLGAPEDYFNLMIFLEKGTSLSRMSLYEKLVSLQYKRTEEEFTRGTFRVRGETVDIFPSDQDSNAVRVVFLGDLIEELREIDPITSLTKKKVNSATIYPLSHFLSNQESVALAKVRIAQELEIRLKELEKQGKLLEASRLEQRTHYDIELLEEIGFCPGIENYSRHLAGRAQGEPPTTLLDYFPDDFMLVIDESHVTVPQIGGMYAGDRSRKKSLVEYGFRLPSALDNRPLNSEEFWQRVGQTIFVSATPGNFELERCQGDSVAKQINRPTGLIDPSVEVRPAVNQVDDLISEARTTIEAGDRVLVTTLTKKMAENLSQYLKEIGIRCRYLHSDIDTVERVEILRGLRRGDFDVLIGINLLREGLDLVEVGLVAILDADKEGFLRSTRSLIQTMGRAARNLNGRVILYGDKVTRSMNEAITETNLRREVQQAFNKRYGIIPKSAKRQVEKSLVETETAVAETTPEYFVDIKDKNVAEERLDQLKKEMYEHAAEKRFEEAAKVRDAIAQLKKLFFDIPTYKT